MKHDTLCINIPCNCDPDEWGHLFTCDMVCTCELISKVRYDQTTRIVNVVIDRISDLHTCNKDDDCSVKAEGVELALDDIYYYVKVENNVR